MLLNGSAYYGCVADRLFNYCREFSLEYIQVPLLGWGGDMARASGMGLMMDPTATKTLGHGWTPRCSRKAWVDISLSSILKAKMNGLFMSLSNDYLFMKSSGLG